MIQLRECMPILLDHTEWLTASNVVAYTISGKATLMFKLIEHNKNIPKSKKNKNKHNKLFLNAGLGIVGKELNKQLSSITGSGIKLKKKTR